MSYVSVAKHASACVCVLLAFLSVCRDCAHISVIMMVHGDERIHFHMPCVCVCVCDTVGWSGPGAASVERNQFKAILRFACEHAQSHARAGCVNRNGFQRNLLVGTHARASHMGLLFDCIQFNHIGRYLSGGLVRWGEGVLHTTALN